MKFALGWLFGGLFVAAYILLVPLDRVMSQRNSCYEEIRIIKDKQI